MSRKGKPRRVTTDASRGPSILLPLITPAPFAPRRCAWWQVALAIAVVVGAAAAAHSPSLRCGFVFDDQPIIVMNRHIRSLTNVPRLFVMNWWKMADVAAADRLYRPLAASSFALDVALMPAPASGKGTAPGELSPRFMHASNLVYHALTCVLVLLLLRSLPGMPVGLLAATGGAVLFAVHPVHTEAVTSLVGRAELLCGLFYFAAALAWLRGTREGDRPGWAWLAGLLWLLSLLSKEMAVTLPVVLVLCDLLRGHRRTLRGWVAAYLPLALAGGIYAGLRITALGVGAFTPYQALEAAHVPGPDRLMTMCHAFACYLRLMVAPVQLCPDYTGFPVTRFAADPVFWGCLLLHAGILAAAGFALHARHSRPAVALIGAGLVGFYAMLFPTSNLVVITGVILSERSLYIPSMALTLSLVAAWHVLAGPGQPAWRRGTAVAAAVLLSAAGIAGSRAATSAWTDEATLFRSAVRHPYCGFVGYDGMARVSAQAGDYAASLDYANRALDLRPNIISQERKAKALLHLNRFAEAAEAQELLLRNIPAEPGQIRTLATCYLRSGKADKAEALLRAYPQWTQPGGPLNAVASEAQRALRR